MLVVAESTAASERAALEVAARESLKCWQHHSSRKGVLAAGNSFAAGFHPMLRQENSHWAETVDSQQVVQQLQQTKAQHTQIQKIGQLLPGSVAEFAQLAVAADTEHRCTEVAEMSVAVAQSLH